MSTELRTVNTLLWKVPSTLHFSLSWLEKQVVGSTGVQQGGCARISVKVH